MPLVEYHARHILVSGADVAQKVIDQLNRGTAFDDLAKRLSNDKTSAVRGGDLGWFPPNPDASGFRRRPRAAQEGRIHQDAGADRRPAGT